MCYHRPMTRLAVLACAATLTAAPLFGADDPLARARQLYNQRNFAAAVQLAEQARDLPGRADAADLVAARSYLKRYRDSGASDDLTNARDRLRRLDPQKFGPLERAEYVVGLGEALFQRVRRRCMVFDAVLQSRDALAGDARRARLVGDGGRSRRSRGPRWSSRASISGSAAVDGSRRIPAAPRRLLIGGGALAGRSPGGVGRRRRDGRARLTTDNGDTLRRSRPAVLRASFPIGRERRRSRPSCCARSGSASRRAGAKIAWLKPARYLVVARRFQPSAQDFASRQLSPIPTSTVRGTLNSAAACMRSRTISAISSARPFGTSNSSSS